MNDADTPMVQINVDFSDEQAAQIAPLIDAARDAQVAGRIGIVMAQVFSHTMKVTFIEHEWAAQIQAILQSRLKAKREARLAKAAGSAP